MDRQPVLEGERLLLRPLTPEDWDALFAVASDPAVWALHPAHDRWQEPVFRAFFADALANEGALVVIEKASGAMVGSSRFQGYDPVDGGSVEIGWTFLARRLWGGGYNAEMKRLMITHALWFVERVLFRVGADNVVSRGAMKNIGGRLTDRTDITMLAGEPIVHVVYEIDRAGYASGPLALQTGDHRIRGQVSRKI
jgi:RimJ/RimL family protein N-acetyltransferase